MGGNESRTVTMLMVTHKLATVQRADKIFVFDEGQVIELSGIHDELAAQGGICARLLEI
jgi:ABC-type multidrug transport system fused ATPase/permease subunit